MLVSPSLTVRLLAHFSDSIEPVELVTPLTTREEEVLRAAARGRSNHEIGDDLFISLSTVKTHINSIFLKLGLLLAEHG